MDVFDPFFLVVSVGLFAGAVVSGLAGFAFSAVAGVFLLHVLPPTEAVPLMMACSIITQVFSMVSLRGSVQWRSDPVVILGGALGVLPALYLLHHIDAYLFRISFGVFLVVYAAYMFLRSKIHPKPHDAGGLSHATVGFFGGLIGGLTAMPGALMVIWCDLHGMPKDQQRAVSQPYVLAMQVIALSLLVMRSSFSTQTLLNATYSLPALLAGVALGVLLFRRINDALFRSAMLGLLLFGGLGLVV